MTWAGESSSSGIMTFTDGDSHGVIEPGAIGEVLTIGADGGFTFDTVPPAPPSSSGVNNTGASTDNAIARWDGPTGKIIQDSAPSIDDSGNIKMPAGQIYGGRLSNAATIQLEDEDFLLVFNGSGTIITMPSSPVQWQAHNIKDGGGVAKQFPIIISGVNTIDGCPTAKINGNYTCLTLVYNGTEWNII